MSFSFDHKPIVIKLGGCLDLEHGNYLRQQMLEIQPENHRLWILDLSRVEFINSAGLSALVQGFTLAQQQGCRLVICNLPDTSRMLFEITQLDRVFEIRESVEIFLQQILEESSVAVA